MIDVVLTLKRITSGLTFQDFVTDEILVGDILYHFIVLGEAANAVPSEIQQLALRIPWDEMRGMRNRLIHAYFLTDLSIVWDTVVNNLDILLLELELLLHIEPPAP